MWIINTIKRIFLKRTHTDLHEERLDPLDNQYRRMQFENKAAGGIKRSDDAQGGKFYKSKATGRRIILK